MSSIKIKNSPHMEDFEPPASLLPDSLIASASNSIFNSSSFSHTYSQKSFDQSAILDSIAKLQTLLFDRDQIKSVNEIYSGMLSNESTSKTLNTESSLIRKKSTIKRRTPKIKAEQHEQCTRLSRSKSIVKLRKVLHIAEIEPFDAAAAKDHNGTQIRLKRQGTMKEAGKPAQLKKFGLKTAKTINFEGRLQKTKAPSKNVKHWLCE